MIVLEQKNINIKKPFSNKNGFTILELLLVVALIGLIAAVSAPMYLSLQSENTMSIAVTNIADILHKTQLHAQAIDSGIAWGVEINTSSVKIFKGENFNTRDQNFDEDLVLDNNILLSGQSEIIFSPLTGWTNTTGTIYIEHIDGRKNQIDFNKKGVLNY